VPPPVAVTGVKGVTGDPAVRATEASACVVDTVLGDVPVKVPDRVEPKIV
jgi:hypothetical protein